MFHELLHLSTLPRRITFPFPLAIFSCSEGLAAGHVVRRLESELEFCFRLGSTEKEAEDCIDDHVYRTGFPFLLIRKPDKQHMHRISGVREALSLYYNGNLMEKFEDVGFDLTLPGRPFVRTTEIDGLVSRMRGLTGIIELPGIVEKMDLLAFQLLETVFLQMQAGGMGAVSSEEERVRRIASYFQLHFSEKIELDPLLRRFGISRRSFFRHWREFYPEPPARYIRSLRFNEAVRQLNTLTLPTETIIRQCGFSDRTLFYRMFRTRFGKTPAEYREPNQKTSSRN